MNKTKLIKVEDERGVYFKECRDTVGNPDKMFYIIYKRKVDGKFKKTEEPVGRQSQGWTAVKARNERSLRVAGKVQTNSEVRAEIKAQQKAEEDRWTFSRLWDQYSTTKHNFKGLSRDIRVFEKHLKPHFGNKEPGQLIPLDVDRFRNQLFKKEALAEQTVKNILELLRRLANYGTKKRLCQGLGFAIEMPKPNNRIEENLSETEVVALMKVLDANTCPEAYIMKLMLYTGRRTGEICKLEWADIDLKGQTMILRDTKTKQNEVLPFSDRAREIIESIPRTSVKYLFPNERGEAKNRCETNHARRMMLEAGISANKRPTYCLRHTFASIAAAEIPERSLKTLLGHRTVNSDITGRYAHIPKAKLKLFADRVAEVIDEMLISSEEQEDRKPEVCYSDGGKRPL